MTNTPAPRRAPAEQDTPVPCEDKASVTPSKRPASSFGKERTHSPHKKAATAAPDEKEYNRSHRGIKSRGSLVPMPGRTKMPVESSSAEGSDEELAGRWGFRDHARRSNAADLAVQHSILVELRQLNQNGRDVISRLDDIRAANDRFHREFEEAMRTANGTNTRPVGRPPHTG